MSGEWQSIETAPRDGTKILAWSLKRGWTEPAVAYWGRNNPLSKASWLGGHCRVSHIDQPTHWMPLPHPPCH